MNLIFALFRVFEIEFHYVDQAGSKLRSMCLLKSAGSKAHAITSG